MLIVKGKIKRLIALTLVISLILSIGWKPIKSYAEDKSIVPIYVECENSTEKVKICYEISSSWNGGYCASIKMINEGSVPIEDWGLRINTFDNILSLWNAENVLRDQNTYYIKGYEWNQDGHYVG